MPKPADLDEEGVGGFFRGTWLIKDEPVSEARRLMREERRVAEVVGELAATAGDFDRLARAAEHGYSSDEPDGGHNLSVVERAALDEFASYDEGAALNGLELGVAGLVYALATVRIIPAASCRGHPGNSAWSERPVVLFAVTEYRARALQPLVESTDCQFALGGDLLAVCGRSILSTMALADAIMANRHAFIKPRQRRLGRPKRSRYEQDRLF